MKTPFRLVPVSRESYRTYVLASRRVRRRVGNKSPSPEEMIQFEIAGRDPGDVAAAYFDHLRDLERAGEFTRTTAARARNWPSRRLQITPRDASLN